MDEKHRKCAIGAASATLYSVDGEEAAPRITVKYENEARGAFGACVVTSDGQSSGKRAAPFNYTGRKVVKVSDFKDACIDERNEKANARPKSGKFKPLDVVLAIAVQPGDHAAAPALPAIATRRTLYGYEAWAARNNKTEAQVSAEIEAAVRRSLCPITDIMRHFVDEGNRLYAGTARANDWRIFHDSLDQWVEPDAQAFMASMGMGARQIKPEGEAAQAFTGTRYACTLVGNRPEHTRALDSHGFHHLSVAIDHHLAMSRTAGLQPTDPTAFDASTPVRLWRAMERVWQVAPSSEQIMADIFDWPSVIDKIIAANGCIVPEEDCRRGVRKAMSKREPGRELKRRPRAEQTKATNLPRALHPDLENCPAVQTALQSLRE